MSENSIRGLLFALGICGALMGPWWLPAVPIILISMRFRAREVLLLGILCDFLWLPSSSFWPPYLVFSILVVWALEPLRKELLLS